MYEIYVFVVIFRAKVLFFVCFVFRTHQAFYKLTLALLTAICRFTHKKKSSLLFLTVYLYKYKHENVYFIRKSVNINLKTYLLCTVNINLWTCLSSVNIDIKTCLLYAVNSNIKTCYLWDQYTLFFILYLTICHKNHYVAIVSNLW